MKSTVLAGIGLSLVFACQGPGGDSVPAAAPAMDSGAVTEERTGPHDNPLMDPELMQRMMVYATPGEPHEELGKGAGSWDVSGKLYMLPGAEGMEMQATAEVEMVLGGRYLLENFKGTMMGQPFEGLLLLGYNNLKEQYQSLWVDNYGTGFSLTSGSAAADGSIELSGTLEDAKTPQGRPYRHVSQHHDNGQATMRLYDTLPDGNEWMVMELTYTRR